MMKNLQDLRVFIETARLGSLSACGKKLNLSPAVVSASIKRLEKELDTLLFIRSTRKLRLTEKGETFLSYCTDVVTLLDNACASLHEDNDFSGTIRLSAPSDLGRNLIVPWLDEFMENYPNVHLQMHLSDIYADLYEQDIDIAIRYFLPKDSSMIAIPLDLQNRLVLCASPEYIAKNGKPKSPQDLENFNCLFWGDSGKTQWTFESKTFPNEKPLKMPIFGNRYSQDGEILKRWAKASKGISLKSYLDIIEELQSGELIEIELDDYQPITYPLYMVFPERRLIDPLISSLKEFLIEKVIDYTK